MTDTIAVAAAATVADIGIGGQTYFKPFARTDVEIV